MLHHISKQWLKHGAVLPLTNLREALVVDDMQLANLRSGTDSERLVALQKLAQRFNELWNAVRDLIRPLEEEIKSARKTLQQLAEDESEMVHRLASKQRVRVERLRHEMDVRLGILAVPPLVLLARLLRFRRQASPNLVELRNAAVITG